MVKLMVRFFLSRLSQFIHLIIIVPFSFHILNRYSFLPMAMVDGYYYMCCGERFSSKTRAP